MTILRLSIAVFLVQMGFQAYTASLPLALARAGVEDAAIGLVMGAAAAVQIPAALVGGRLVDTFGAPRLFTAGGILYLLASGVLLLPGVDVDGSLAPFVLARMLQGAGIAMVLPSALSLVPRMVAAARVAHGLSIVGAAQNLTLVLAPVISLVILDATSLDGVAVSVVCVVVVGILLGQRLPPAALLARPRHDGRREPTLRDHLPPRVDHAAADHHHLRGPLGSRDGLPAHPRRGGGRQHRALLRRRRHRDLPDAPADRAGWWTGSRRATSSSPGPG